MVEWDPQGWFSRRDTVTEIPDVEFGVPTPVAFDFLVRPANRPVWQRSLRRVDHVVDTDGSGTTWRDVTRVAGVTPRLSVTVFDRPHLWSERGTWSRWRASLTLSFRSVPTGCVVSGTFDVSGPGAWLLRRMAAREIARDLRRAAELLTVVPTDSRPCGGGPSDAVWPTVAAPRRGSRPEPSHAGPPTERGPVDTSDDTKSLEELLNPGDTYMLVTGMLGTGLAAQPSSRPLTVASVDGARIRTLVDTTADWSRSLSAAPAVHVVVSDTQHHTFLSLNGTATLSTSEAEIDELWNPMAGAFFEQGREDPNIGVLHLDLTAGEYWSGPSGRIGSIISFVKAKLGSAEDSGEHGDVTFESDAD